MAQQQIVMKPDKQCKGSIRFATEDPEAAVSSVYVSRSVPGIAAAKSVIVTIETSQAS